VLTGINSDLPSVVTAQVTSDVYESIYQKYVLIPRGSKLIGLYNSQISPGQERLLVAMTRLILPDGTWISLTGILAADSIGQSGMTSEVNNHFLKMFGSSLIIGASSFFLNGRDVTTSSTSNGTTTTGGSILGKALDGTLNSLLERNKNIVPTMSNQPRHEFQFIVAKDLAMRPYHR
jgi:type IV secretory pathway VirB10-like protein